MTERNRRIFISDIHISHAPEIGPGKHDYTWLQQKDSDALTNFLKHVNTRQDVEEVIFIGDLFDNWVVPVDVEPPTIDEIITTRKKKNDPLIEALFDLCQNQNIRVVCLPGNHDMELTAEVVAKHFGKDSEERPKMIFGGTAIWNAGSSVYRSSRLLSEHGSAHAMFNAPDPVNNPGVRLPLGYYISRVAATKTHNTGHSDRHWWTYADDILEMVGPEKLASSVFEAIMGEAHLPLDTEIIMPKRNGQDMKVTAQEILTRYENLYSQWKERVGAGIAFKSILAEIGYLDDAADRLCKKHDTNIVIFGHSHDWILDKDSWFVEDRIYANCGTWCDSPRKPWTYVEIETLRDQNKRWVRVQEWMGDMPGETLKEAYVTL
ncbi:MAG: metallophosphoesterase [Thermodesulfovibrionales bacterium]|jgi:UDP-2,3-diacylglucosamine pyrophosphatase LpxH